MVHTSPATSSSVGRLLLSALVSNLLRNIMGQILVRVIPVVVLMLEAPEKVGSFFLATSVAAASAQSW